MVSQDDKPVLVSDDAMVDTPVAPTSAPIADAEIVNFGLPRKKPKMDIKAAAPGSSDLFSRLSSFLPQMKAANDQLEDERIAGRLDFRRMELNDESSEEEEDSAVEEKEKKPYIEMNLGLGVLEEKRPSKKNKNKQFTGTSEQIAQMLNGDNEEESETSDSSDDSSSEEDSSDENDDENDDDDDDDDDNDGNVEEEGVKAKNEDVMAKLMGTDAEEGRKHKKPKIEEI